MHVVVILHSNPRSVILHTGSCLTDCQPNLSSDIQWTHHLTMPSARTSYISVHLDLKKLLQREDTNLESLDETHRQNIQARMYMRTDISLAKDFKTPLSSRCSVHCAPGDYPFHRANLNAPWPFYNQYLRFTTVVENDDSHNLPFPDSILHLHHFGCTKWPTLLVHKPIEWNYWMAPHPVCETLPLSKLHDLGNTT